jgi:hypothetical protein
MSRAKACLWQEMLHWLCTGLHASAVVIEGLQAGRFGVRVAAESRWFFSKRPDQLWVIPSLLFTGYQGRYSGTNGQGVILTGWEWVELSPFYAFLAWIGTTVLAAPKGSWWSGLEIFTRCLYKDKAGFYVRSYERVSWWGRILITFDARTLEHLKRKSINVSRKEKRFEEKLQGKRLHTSVNYTFSV